MMTSSLTMRYQHEITQLVNGDHFDPHTFLGLHQLTDDRKVIRVWRPQAKSIHAEVKGEIIELKRIHEAGLFEYVTLDASFPNDYRIYHQSGTLCYDPYAQGVTIGEFDLYLFAKGVHYRIYEMLGAHLGVFNGIEGVRFAVWAPSARRVSLVGDFNHWDGRTNPMRVLGSSGVWEIFIPGLKEGEKYKFEIKTDTGAILVKSDPYAYSAELRPLTASTVANINRFAWSDDAWIKKRQASQNAPKPINIYEVHLGSWKRENGHFMNYRTIAIHLAAYCREMGFTYIELMPIQEHPLDESWGYQVSGYYACTSRFGTPEDFQWFVNHLHECEIGVILDWVPGHFPTDNFSLGQFDGTALYEHVDPRQGFHPHWNTYIFNYGRHEVSNFLIGNALYWLEKMHVDGLRVDAVASMLYLDYGRQAGEWIPNVFGGKENLEAIEFLKHLNSVVHERFPGILMIAEESTSFPRVTGLPRDGGLGFDLKWNMGWMNDTLNYFSEDMIFRHYHQHNLTFGLLYAFSEKFCLVLSHDEVVHGKQSLLSKMPGDTWQRFANLRLLYSYMMCQPGKKLIFMGAELGMWNEWNVKAELEWFLLQYPIHQGLQQMIKELNHFYLAHSALFEKDFSFEGFEWVDFSDRQNSVVSYLRKGGGAILLCVHNFTPQFHGNYHLNLKNLSSIEEVFNSDEMKYGGSGKTKLETVIECDENHRASSLKLSLAPLATMIFRVNFWSYS